MVDDNLLLFSRLSVELFLSSDESHGPIFILTTFKNLFFSKCRFELQNSSPPTTDDIIIIRQPPPPLDASSDCLRFFKTVRLLAELFNNNMVSESTRQFIIDQVLMNPISPPQRNIDAMNYFLCFVCKLPHFHFSDENFKLLVQNSMALEMERNYNKEAKLRKEAEEALAIEKEELELMKRLLESYKEDKDILLLESQQLDQNYQQELQLRKETQQSLSIEKAEIENVKLRLETLENENDGMLLKAEELKVKYEGEVIVRKETEIALNKERNELEAMRQVLEICQIEQETLTLEKVALVENYIKEFNLRKETEEDLSREKQELEIVKGILEAYNQEADSMKQERDNAIKTVQELTRKQQEEEEEKEREPPQSFYCPITQEVMKEPNIAADGFTYEAEAIKRWLTTHDTSPMTNLKLPNRNIVPNRALRSAIRDLALIFPST
ncbi:unnamed protein product [Cochlearia groenlandica]